MQRLNGRVAALACFIARSAERSLPFFRALRGADAFQWAEEQQQAFEDLKAYLSHPAIAKGGVSAVLVEEHNRAGRPEQTTVYYVSKALSIAKTQYSELEKMVYAVVVASRKLKH